MNEKKLEAISALMDGEVRDGDQFALDGWTRDEDLRATWGRYHLISESMRGTLPRHMDPSLAAKIAAAIQDEPVMLAPDAPYNRPWLKPIAGMAIAASVATLAVVGIQMNRAGAPDAGLSQGSMASRDTGALRSGTGGQVNLAAGRVSARPLRPEGTVTNPSARKGLVVPAAATNSNGESQQEGHSQ
jgi:Anti sigma-E protein RseA, N-terminal domain